MGQSEAPRFTEQDLKDLEREINDTSRLIERFKTERRFELNQFARVGNALKKVRLNHRKRGLLKTYNEIRESLEPKEKK